MKSIVFILTMPNCGSWNGKWSGEDDFYCRRRTYKNDDEKLKNVMAENYHYYNFGDGWGAGVEVKEMTAKEARKLASKSKGFRGYDWMIDEIEEHGRILIREERQKTKEVSLCQ